MKELSLNNDYKMPMVGLGTWKSAPGAVYQAIRWAIKLGYKHIDCAPVYGNQKEVGQALHDAVAEGDIKRKDLFITSKLWNDSHKPEDVIPALKETLADLQLEYLDLFLIHWPVAQKKGVGLPSKAEDLISLKDLPIEMTWKAMENAQKEGLVYSIGVSNFGIKKLQSLIEKAEILPAVNQVECHPLLQQKELLGFCEKNMIALTAYSPLGSMDRTEAMKHANEPIVLENPVILEIAKRLKATPAQILLAWELQRNVIVIPKSIHQDRIKENFAAQAIELDSEDIKRIAALDVGYRYVDGASFIYGDYTIENIFA